MACAREESSESSLEFDTGCVLMTAMILTSLLMIMGHQKSMKLLNLEMLRYLMNFF